MDPNQQLRQISSERHLKQRREELDRAVNSETTMDYVNFSDFFKNHTFTGEERRAARHIFFRIAGYAALGGAFNGTAIYFSTRSAPMGFRAASAVLATSFGCLLGGAIAVSQSKQDLDGLSDESVLKQQILRYWLKYGGNRQMQRQEMERRGPIIHPDRK